MGQSLHRGKKPINYRKKSLKGIIIPIVAVIAVVAIAVGGVIVLSKIPGATTDPTASKPSETAPTTGKTLPKSFIDRNTASEYVVLADVTTGKTLYQKNAEQLCYPASMTKLLTALVALDQMAADTPVTVGDEIYLIDPQSSRAYLTVGMRMTMENLLQAILLPSGNDAAYTIAVAVARQAADNPKLDRRAAVTAFAELMNKKALALGCQKSHFVNPDGIHDPDHYTTANDMLKIATAALQNETLARIVATPTARGTMLSGHAYSWQNSNRLIQENGAYSYDGATGLKTGSTTEAGYCLAASAQRDGKTCVAIVMGAKSESGRWEDASGLLDISFQ